MTQTHKTKKWFLKEFLLPFTVMLGITGALMMAFWLSIGLGGNIAPVNEIADEVTKPTLGRLIYVVLGLALSIVLGVTASRLAKGKKIRSAFYCGFTAGVMLWQSIGEGSWHFGYFEDGAYVNFYRLESASSVFIIAAFMALVFMLMKHSKVNFGILTLMLAFLSNWFGHVVMIGSYPYVSRFFEVSRWYSVCGLCVGSILSLAAVIIPLRRPMKMREHLLYSMLLYIGIAIIGFGLAE